MINYIKSLYNKLIEKLCSIYMQDEIDSWIHDYWNDLYNAYLGDDDAE